ARIQEYFRLLGFTLDSWRAHENAREMPQYTCRYIGTTFSFGQYNNLTKWFYENKFYLIDIDVDALQSLDGIGFQNGSPAQANSAPEVEIIYDEIPDSFLQAPKGKGLLPA